jgi:hypothetical protein
MRPRSSIYRSNSLPIIRRARANGKFGIKPNQEDFVKATKIWQRRGAVCTPSSEKAIADWASNELRGAYFAIVDSIEISPAAEKRMEEERQKVPSIDCYQNWKELPANADLIHVYWPDGGEPEFGDVWRRCSDSNEKLERGKGTLQLVVKVPKLLGRSFTLREQKRIEKKFSETLNEMYFEHREKSPPGWAALFALDEVAERWAKANPSGLET